MREKLLGINIDYVRIDQAIDLIKKLLQKTGKHYVVTPNPEMLVDAGSDLEFKKALNEAKLSIPDSPRLGWGSKTIRSKHLPRRLIYLPFLLFPKIFSGKEYPTTTGTDLMEHLLALSEERGFITGFIGSTPGVAEKLTECLKKTYPKLKIAFCSGNIKVDVNGESSFDIKKDSLRLSKSIKQNQYVIPANAGIQLDPDSSRLLDPHRSSPSTSIGGGDDKFNAHTLSQKIDILFVAFGHKKQEKWMRINLSKLNARVMVGVGGAFDYISGSVPRAPEFMRVLGLEWLFRVIIQPWRIKRFWKLPVFVYKILTSK